MRLLLLGHDVDGDVGGVRCFLLLGILEKTFCPLTDANGDAAEAYAMKPLAFGVDASVAAEGFSCCSGGGDCLFDRRGLPSPSPSSLGRLAVSADAVWTEGLDGALSGPWLVPRSASLRFNPFSGSATSDSEARRV